MVHLPFSERFEAGRSVAQELEGRKLGPAAVMGLARGGVPVAFAVAQRLRLPLEVVVVRKLGVPWQPELAMGAIAGSARFLDIPMIQELGVSDQQIENVIAREQMELKRKQDLYHQSEPQFDLDRRTAILVDDGLATGSTMLAAIRMVRSREPALLIVAVPVGSQQACKRVSEEADEVVCVTTPARFDAVGRWYRDFRPVTDEDVWRLLAESRRQPTGAGKVSAAG